MLTIIMTDLALTAPQHSGGAAAGEMEQRRLEGILSSSHRLTSCGTAPIRLPKLACTGARNAQSKRSHAQRTQTEFASQGSRRGHRTEPGDSPGTTAQ